MRARAICVVGLLAAFGIAATAFATFQPQLLYKPPEIVLRDLAEHNSSEDVLVTQDGNRFVFSNGAVGSGIDPESDEGCEFVTNTISCPAAGVRSITVKLLNNADTGEISLGSKAGKVKQKLLGGDDGDTLSGGDGKQVIKGQDGADDLTGGPGPDVINGGPGSDLCDGGPGKDEIRNCEPLAPG